jgi:hypothetical protein
MKRRKAMAVLFGMALATGAMLFLGPPIIWSSWARSLQAGDGPLHAIIFAHHRNGDHAPPTRILVSAGPSERTQYVAIAPVTLQCFEWRWRDRIPEGAPLGPLSPALLQGMLPGAHGAELAPRLDQFVRDVARSSVEALAAPFPLYPPEPTDTAVADPGSWYALFDGSAQSLRIQLVRPGLIWLATFGLWIALVWLRRRLAVKHSEAESV